MHSTPNLDDGYLGSGKILRYSRKKHGDENHRKEIVEFLPTREALKLREKEIVNEALLADPLNINLRYGGEGGGGFTSAAHKQNFQKAAAVANLDWGSRPEAPLIAAKRIETLKRQGNWNPFGGKHDSFLNRNHTPETREKISSSMQGLRMGEQSSQYGTCWVSNEKHTVKIKRECLSAYLENGYSRGRRLVRSSSP
jgi:hypothetical protein